MAPKPEIDPQNLTPSCNEALILASLREGPKHGYQLAIDIDERSDGFFRFQHGTLYPILHKLEKRGLIKGSWTREGSDGVGRKRKSYALTAPGRRYADQQLEAWRAFVNQFVSAVDLDGAGGGP